MSNNLKQKDDSYWKDRLTAQQYQVLRNAATEQPFTGELLHNKEEGTYQCAACGQELFSSDTKFESGSGWPSFYDVVAKRNVELIKDTSLGMTRTEVRCSNCDSHLGHVFEDGPKDATGLRYCINSTALSFNNTQE